MKSTIAPAHALSLGFVAAGLAWPSVYGLITHALRTPYERALMDAYCGAAPHVSGVHCPPCWIGAAAFFLAALVIVFSQRQPARRTVR